MLGAMFKPVAVAAALLMGGGPVWAQSTNDLLSALGAPQIIEIMRAEGLEYGETLAADMIPGGGSANWTSTLERIYDEDRMLTTVHEAFARTFGDTDPAPLLAFFTSETGQQIVDLEISARTAMRDPEIEETARAAFRNLDGSGSDPLRAISDFVETNDLVNANVVGALNANYLFFQGLVAGGAVRMSEADILSEVWSTEEQTRADTREWVHAFLLMAYGPLPDGVIEEYTALSRTEAGRALNLALFAGFNQMYDDISYALGLAIGREMQVQDL